MSGLDLKVTAAVRRGADFTLDADLSFPAGATTALLGPNGAGKSTLIELVAGLVPPDRGSIVLGGRALTDTAMGIAVPPEARGVGVVFQRYLLFDHLDVRDNVAFGLRARGMRRAAARTAADTWLRRFAIDSLAAERPSRLSGGQAQRVALARALAVEPDVLLLDEPLAAVDVAGRAKLRRVLRTHLGTFAGPRVLITHDPVDAALLADHVVVLEAGRVVQQGTPDEIRLRPATPYVAALAGTNLFVGEVGEPRTVDLVDHRLSLTVADSESRGTVLVTIAPRAVALHADRPTGSPRNVWQTMVELVEPLGDTTRVVLGSPVPLAADITPAAAEAMALRPGTAVWASVKATEIGVAPAE